MAALTEWKVPPSAQPRVEDYPYDLERALSSVVGLHSIIPPDGFTAETLGVERAGNGVLIDNGLVLTIGYLITEAATVWLHLGDGHVVEGHALGFDQETGFGLVQALGKIDLPAPPITTRSPISAARDEPMGSAGRSILPSACTRPKPVSWSKPSAWPSTTWPSPRCSQTVAASVIR